MPLKSTLRKMESSNRKTAFKVFRDSSSGFVAKKHVREFVFEQDSYKCVKCGRVVGLQVDHIESVKKCFDKKKYHQCNTLGNLQTLCKKCNASKQP